MAKIKKFQFKNIRSYGNKMVDIPFDMDNGLVLIQGKNGGGKTSIVEALEFAIYGKSSRVPVMDLPNWINHNAFTTIEFETDDNRKVELSRGISPDFYDLKVGGSAYSSKTPILVISVSENFPKASGDTTPKKSLILFVAFLLLKRAFGKTVIISRMRLKIANKSGFSKNESASRISLGLSFASREFISNGSLSSAKITS